MQIKIVNYAKNNRKVEHYTYALLELFIAHQEQVILDVLFNHRLVSMGDKSFEAIE